MDAKWSLPASLVAEPVSPSLQPPSTPRICARHMAQPTPDHWLSPIRLAVWLLQLHSWNTNTTLDTERAQAVDRCTTGKSSLELEKANPI